MRKLELAAIALVLLVILGTPVAAFTHGMLLPAEDVEEFTLVGRHGQWTPDIIRVTEGETVRLRLTSADVVHAFAAQELGLRVDHVYPGKVTIVEFTAPRAGTYKFICFVRCHKRHSSMEGQIVVEPAASCPGCAG